MNPSRLSSSLAPFPFTVVGISLVLSCSSEERRRWLSAARKSGGDVAWIGPASGVANQGVCYHQCMGLVRNEDGLLWVWDDGKLLLPPQADLPNQHRTIIAIKVTEKEVPQVSMPADPTPLHERVVSNTDSVISISIDAINEESNSGDESDSSSDDAPIVTTKAAPVLLCRFGSHTLKLEQWYSFLPASHAMNVNDIDMGTMPSIINIPLSAEYDFSSPSPSLSASLSSVSSHFVQPVLPLAAGRKVVVFVSGCAMNDDNPAPGSGIARALKVGSMDSSSNPSVGVSPYPIHIVGVDYSLASAGMECPALDESLIIDSWENVSCRDHTRDILRRLAQDPLAFWIPSSDCEVALIAKGLMLLRKDKDLAGRRKSAASTPSCSPSPSSSVRDWSQAASRVLIPTFSALDYTAKPCLDVARILHMDVPPTMLVDRSTPEGSVLSLHSLLSFVTALRGPFWVKGEVFGACIARNYGDAARAISSMQSAIDQAVIIQMGVQGIGKGVAFAAVEGRLTAAVGFTKAQSTMLLKGWSGVLETVDAPLLARIKRLVSAMKYTGGGELEYIEGLDGRRAFIDFNARFPAWIYASTLIGANLPAALLQHALHNMSKQQLHLQGAERDGTEGEVAASKSTVESKVGSAFACVVPFPSFASESSQVPGRRVHYTRSIVEIVSKIQPSMLYTSFDAGMAGEIVAHAHPAKLTDMAKVLLRTIRTMI